MAVQRKDKKAETSEVAGGTAAETSVVKTVRSKKPAKKLVKAKPVLTAPLDPFAEIAKPTSPVKKPRASRKTAVKKVKQSPVAPAIPPAPAVAVEAEPDATPAFEVLADVKLPALERENRARLQMQSPTRLHLYWSLRENPWASLRKVFGDAQGSYTLALKLIDVTNGTEEIHQCDAAGDRWFDVDANTEYRAEIGFYAPNRPYFRVVYSNSILTPRRSPSTRPATESQWRVSSDKFAQVLDVAGFSRDAFDVAMAGDNLASSEDVTRTAFFSLISREEKIEKVPTEDIRYAMLSLAAGVEIDELRGRVNRRLFEILAANAERLTPSRTMETLSEHFDIEDSDFSEEILGSAVFGASVVNFPRTSRTRTGKKSFKPRTLSPLSSHSIR